MNSMHSASNRDESAAAKVDPLDALEEKWRTEAADLAEWANRATRRRRANSPTRPREVTSMGDRTAATPSRRNVDDIRTTGAGWVTEEELEWLCDQADLVNNLRSAYELKIQDFAQETRRASFLQGQLDREHQALTELWERYEEIRRVRD